LGQSFLDDILNSNDMLNNKVSYMNYVKDQFQQATIFLLPVRLFIGLAWMRAGLEKLFDLQWYSGDTMIQFFQEQIQSGAVVFPFYRSLIHSVFEPSAGILAGIILFAELYVGIAILFGCFTNLALIGGISMNLNFLLAGSANPSIFYIVIQGFLLFMNGGSVLSIDSVISQKFRSWFFIAQKERPKLFHSTEPRVLSCLAAVTFAIALWSTYYIQDSSLGKPDDPALSIVMLCLMSGVLFGTLAIQSWSKDKEDAALLRYPEQSENVLVSSMQTRYKQQADIVTRPAPAIPQMSVNDYATLLVPHNMIDKAVPQSAAAATPKAAMADSAYRKNSSTQSHIQHKQRTELDTFNEMSTLLVPYSLSKNSSSKKVDKYMTTKMGEMDDTEQNIGGIELHKISIHI